MKDLFSAFADIEESRTLRLQYGILPTLACNENATGEPFDFPTSEPTTCSELMGGVLCLA